MSHHGVEFGRTSESFNGRLFLRKDLCLVLWGSQADAMVLIPFQSPLRVQGKVPGSASLTFVVLVWSQYCSALGGNACAFPPKATPPPQLFSFPWRFPLLACKPTDGLKHSFVLCVTRIQLHCSRRLGKHLVCHFVGGRRSQFLFKTKHCQVVKYLNVSQFFFIATPRAPSSLFSWSEGGLNWYRV